MASPRWGLGGYANVGAIGCSALESSQISWASHQLGRVNALQRSAHKKHRFLQGAGAR